MSDDIHGNFHRVFLLNLSQVPVGQSPNSAVA